MRILATSFHPMISRNLLLSGFVDALGDQDHLGLLIPKIKVGFFSRTFGRSSVSFFGVETLQSSRRKIGLFLKKLTIWLHDTPSSRNLRRYSLHLTGNFFVYTISSFFAFFSRLPGVVPLYRAADRFFCPQGYYLSILNEFSPDVVLLTDIQNENDILVAHDAVSLGIPIVGMVRSWDNLSLRMLRVVPDLLLVPSLEIKSEAVNIHGLSEHQVYVVGYPHYDRYSALPRRERKDLCSFFGMNPSLPVILYAPVSDALIRKNDIDSYVLNSLRSLTNVNVLVRFPPEKPVSLGDFIPPPNFFFHHTGVSFDGGHFGEREIGEEDDTTLHLSLSGCDLVITGPTSLLLDSLYFDKPCIAVDMYPSERLVWDRVWRYNDVHVQKALSAGLAVKVNTPAELRSDVVRFLGCGHNGGGAAARLRWFSHSDGQSIDRILYSLRLVSRT